LLVVHQNGAAQESYCSLLLLLLLLVRGPHITCDSPAWRSTASPAQVDSNARKAAAFAATHFCSGPHRRSERTPLPLPRVTRCTDTV